MDTKTKLLGIDPGKNGAIAHAGGAIKMPETVGDLVDALRSLSAEGYRVAYVEQVATSPQMGVRSAGTFMRGLGNIEAACYAVGIALVWVLPNTWQKALRCQTKGNKNVTKRKAQELFPTLTITHGNADALLIREYGIRKEGGSL